jgi:hypothetical protein
VFVAVRPHDQVIVPGVSAGRPAGRRTRACCRWFAGPRHPPRDLVLVAQVAAAVSNPVRAELPRGVLRTAGRHVYFEQIRVLKAGSNVAGCP